MLSCGPEILARKIIAEYGFSYPPVNAGIILPDYPLKVVLRDWPADISGVFVRGDTISHIGLNANHPLGRRHFTLWHEFFHYVAHNGLRYFDYGNRAVASRIEFEANRFAASLLMPEGWIRLLWDKHDGNVSQMARDCLVSRQAMRVRIHELGLI